MTATRPGRADLVGRFSPPYTSPRPRRCEVSRLVVTMLLPAFIAAGCSSAAAGGSPASSPASGAATGSAGTTSLSRVTLHIGDQAGSGAQALLTAAGLIHKLPFKVTWSDFTSGPPMLQAMGAGAVDIGSVGNAPPVFAAAGGDKIAIVGALKANPLGSALLVSQNSPIHSIAQLRGKRIAVAQGSSADYHLLTVLKKAGLSVHDVTLDYLQPAEGLAALASDHVDAWDIWSPFIEQAEAQDHARALVNGTGFGSPYSFTVASRAALADTDKAAAIGEYLKLLDQAHAWAASHGPSWASVWAQGTGLPVAVMVNAARDSQATAVPITPAVVDSEQRVADAFTAAGLIPGHVNFSDFVDTAFNSTVGSSSS
jgi:sulfonate transport system substrate-binding protein